MTVQLGDLAAARVGMIDPAKHPDTQFCLYSIPAYDAGSPTVVYGRDIGSAKQIVKRGDVLLSRIVPHLRRAWIVNAPTGQQLIASNEWMVFDDPRAEPSYLRHFLLSDRFHAQFMQTVAGVGGSLLRAKTALVARIETPLPSLPEQRRIAALLDTADAVRRKREESRCLVDELIRSVFMEMFGEGASGADTWPEVNIGSIATDTQYGTSAKANSNDTGRPVLRMGNLTTSGAIDLSDLKWCAISERDEAKYTVRRGDLLFNRTNSPELVGKAAVWDRDDAFAFAGYLVRARFDISRALPEYVSAYLNSTQGKRMLRQVAKPSNNMSNISASELRRLPIRLPPVALQQHFRGVVRRAAQTDHRLADALGASLALNSALTSQFDA